MPSGDTRLFLEWLDAVLPPHPDHFVYVLARPKKGQKVTRLFIPREDLVQGVSSAVDQLVDTHHVWMGMVTFASDKRATKGQANPTQLVWIDHDGDPEANPHEWKPTPHACWQTSPGRYQAVWILDNPPTKEATEELCAALAKRYGADPSGKDIVQVLRIPGTLNHKQDPPSPVRALWLRGAGAQPPYGPQALQVAAPVTGEVPPVAPGGGPAPESGSKDHALYMLGKLGVPQQMVADTFATAQPDRSTALYSLMATLTEKGASPTETYRIASHSANQKFDTPERLWEDVLRTAAKTPGAKGYLVERAGALVPVDETLQWIVEPCLYDDAVGTVVGEPSTRKSWAALQILTAIACPEAKEFLGFPVLTHGPVLYFDLDDRRPRRLKRRLGNILEYYRGERDYDLPFHYVTGNFNYTDPRWQEKLNATLAEIEDEEGAKVVLTVIDTLHRAGFSPKDWGANAQPLLNGLSEMAVDYRRAYLIVHHSPKVRETVQRNVRNAPWGSTFTGASLDPTWSLSRNFSEDDREDAFTHINLNVWSKEGPEHSVGWVLAYGKDKERFEVERRDATTEEKIMRELTETGETLTFAELGRRIDDQNQQVGRAARRLHQKGRVELVEKGSSWLVSLPQEKSAQSEF